MLRMEDEAGTVLGLSADGCAIRGWSFAAELNGAKVSPSSLKPGESAAAGTLSLSLTFDNPPARWGVNTTVDGGRRTMASSLTNLSDAPIAVGKVFRFYSLLR